MARVLLRGDKPGDDAESGVVMGLDVLDKEVLPQLDVVQPLSVVPLLREAGAGQETRPLEHPSLKLRLGR